MYALLTMRGTIIVYDISNDCIRHVSLASLQGALSLVTCRSSCGWVVLETRDSLRQIQLTADASGGGMRRVPAASVGSLFELTPHPSDPEWLSISLNSYYICADDAEQVTLSRRSASTWECFLPVDLRLVEQLVATMDVLWISQARHDHTTTMPFQLRPGGQISAGRWTGAAAAMLNSIKVEPNNSETSTSISALTIRHRWRLERLLRYQPLVYYTAFGKQKYIDAFRQSLYSLRKIAGYSGAVLLFTDISEDVVRDLVKDVAGELHIHPLPIEHHVDAWTSRYRLFDWPFAAQFQPYLYIDTDVIFDRPLDSVLHELVRSETLSAATELTSAYSKANSVGYALFLEDKQFPGGFGMNSGTIGIPTLRVGKPILPLIHQNVRAYYDEKGQYACWYDQPHMNYLADRMQCFDPEIIGSRLRFNADDPAGAIGFVHFWAEDTGIDRVRRMSNYIAALEARRAFVAHADPVPQPDLATTFLL